MSEFNKIKSNGTLTLNKKKIKGCMVSTETEAVFSLSTITLPEREAGIFTPSTVFVPSSTKTN